MVKSQIKILSQSKCYLQLVTVAQYNEIISPMFVSPAGAHIRHILDHYVAIKVGLETGCIDYDKRTRGGAVESNIEQALLLISEIETFLHSLSEKQLAQTIPLSTEVSVEKKQVEIVPTTLARELIFAGTHAIHHYAMIEQIAKCQKITMPAHFGIAPATATFMREQKCAR